VAEAAGPPVGRFDRDTAVRREGGSGAEASFAAEVSPDWRAGRGPHGGYLAAMLLRALTETVADPARAPRSLTIHYTRAPEPGPISIHTVIERSGRSLSTLSARMEQDGVLTALALAAFSVPWSGPELSDIEMPRVAAPDLAAPGGESAHPQAPPIAHRSTQHRRFGGTPFSGADQPMELGGWLGHEEPRAIDALSLAFFSDALLPGPFMRLTEPNAAPTIDLTIHFRSTVPHPGALTDDEGRELCLARITTGLVHEGFFEEDGVIWAADGTMLSQSRQLALLLPMPIG
jgi:acyl-CoA thioesterase